MYCLPPFHSWIIPEYIPLIQGLQSYSWTIIWSHWYQFGLNFWAASNDQGKIVEPLIWSLLSPQKNNLLGHFLSIFMAIFEMSRCWAEIPLVLINWNSRIKYKWILWIFNFIRSNVISISKYFFRKTKLYKWGHQVRDIITEFKQFHTCKNFKFGEWGYETKMKNSQD